MGRMREGIYRLQKEKHQLNDQLAPKISESLVNRIGFPLRNIMEINMRQKKRGIIVKGNNPWSFRMIQKGNKVFEGGGSKTSSFRSSLRRG